MLNDRVVPFFEQHDLRVMRMLTDRGTEYCGNRETHEFELYLAIEDIDHSKIKGKESSDKRHLREVQPYRAERVLRHRFPQEDIHLHRTASGRPRRMDESLQHREDTLRKILLRKNTDADFHRGYRRGKEVRHTAPGATLARGGDSKYLHLLRN